MHLLNLLIKGVIHHSDEHIEDQNVGEENPEDENVADEPILCISRASIVGCARLLERVSKPVAEGDLKEGEGCVCYPALNALAAVHCHGGALKLRNARWYVCVDEVTHPVSQVIYLKHDELTADMRDKLIMNTQKAKFSRTTLNCS